MRVRKWRGARGPHGPVVLAIIGTALACGACGSTTNTIIIKTVTGVSRPSTTANPKLPPRYAPGDQNLSDPNAAPCESRSFTQADVGPHAFCATADEVIQIFSGNTPNPVGGDPNAELPGAGAFVAAQEGSALVRFRCTLTGQVLDPHGPGATARIVRCISKTDPQDWFEFELT